MSVFVTDDAAMLSLEARRRFRSRLGWGFAAWLGNFVLVIIINTTSFKLRGKGLSNEEFMPLGIWCMSSFLVAAVRFGFWRCPRCGNFWNLFNGYARRCGSCDLPR